MGGVGECAADLLRVRTGVSKRGGVKEGRTPEPVEGPRREASPVLENMSPTSLELISV